jgi:hypothetical protein
MPALSFHRAKILLLGLSIGLPSLLTSCKSEPTAAQGGTQEQVENARLEEKDLKTEIAEYFRDTTYSFEISQMPVRAISKEGAVTGESLPDRKFTLFISCLDVPNREDAKKVDAGLRSILGEEQYGTAIINYVRDSSAETRAVETLQSMMVNP